MKKYFTNLVCLILGIIPFLGCKKQLEVEAPSYTVNEVSVYQTNASAASVMTGVLQNMAAGDLWRVSTLPALSADEMTLNIPSSYMDDIKYFKNSLNGQDYSIYWGFFYGLIYSTNAAEKGLSSADKLTPAVRNHLLGEAKFLRAYFYYYLVNFYGDVPLILDTDYKLNRQVKRNPANEIYDQIKLDLIAAQELLSTDFLDATILNPTSERVRPTKWAATALLAKVYLHLKKYPEAEAEATKIIQNPTFQLPELDQVFLKTSTEAIFQLQTVVFNKSTNEARYFIIPKSGFTPDRPAYMSSRLLNAFEDGDMRKTKWVGYITVGSKPYNYPYKYKDNSNYVGGGNEYVTVMRLAEQYLIRAEARIMQNNAPGGIADLNTIRNRATDQTALPANRLAQINLGLDRDAAFAVLIHEKQVELFTEWGSRWIDLKRTGLADIVMPSATTEKGGTWTTNAQLYPVPYEQILLDPNLTQNPGY